MEVNTVTLNRLFVVGQNIMQLQSMYRLMPGEKITRLKIMRYVSFGALKRSFDFVMASTLLLGLSPMFLIVAMGIKLDSPGPVFFRQKRTGKGGKEFNMYKFRSMAADNDVRDVSCEDKYTKFGKVLRRTSIDELPQLINIVRGQMSFIGPRPWVTEYWSNMNDEERMRAMVRPGITGLVAAKGRNGLSVFEKIEYDLEYVRNYSLRQDIKIVFLTMKTVAKGDEVNAGKSGIHNDIKELKKRNRG